MTALMRPEFGCQALDLVTQENLGGQVGKDLRISYSCLRRWMSINDVDAGRNEGLTSAERKEFVEFRHRNRALEIDLEILKRDGACFARKNILPLQSNILSTNEPAERSLPR